MGAWMRLASRAAFRKGIASYCGYENAVEPGMWAGGVVGLKSILGVRSRAKALETLDTALFYRLICISFSLTPYKRHSWRSLTGRGLCIPASQRLRVPFEKPSSFSTRLWV